MGEILCLVVHFKIFSKSKLHTLLKHWNDIFLLTIFMALERNKDISRFSAFKTPATTEYFFELISRKELPELVEVLNDIRKQNLPIVYIASGTNCLFAFDHFPGIIVHIRL